ncbi:MAG: hydrogen peroxide-inducible genes activator [Marinifilaceae bacterium]|jgi:LysR family hydrogen peroxide-inducible transcriptional activator|nr:hydrogen peroxide-inducible genes activator [Marinifilaceae bacterium]
MKIQQLKYIIALDEHRHFVRAAEYCKVSQSTLSSMIQKLEEELDVQIFDRNAHPIKPTLLGETLIAQARDVVSRINYIKESVISEKTNDLGNINMGIIPTIAPYILPDFIKKISNTNIKINISETKTETIIEELKKGEIDFALLATPLDEEDILEIPIYYERFVAYISPNDPLFINKNIESSEIPTNNLWLLQEGHCFRSQILNICNNKDQKNTIYEAGSINTLINIVDNNGGFTVIPELHINLLSDSQKNYIRDIINPEPVREISIIIRNDFVREKILNVIINIIKEIIPEHMLNERLKKFAVKL